MNRNEAIMAFKERMFVMQNKTKQVQVNLENGKTLDNDGTVDILLSSLEDAKNLCDSIYEFADGAQSAADSAASKAKELQQDLERYIHDVNEVKNISDRQAEYLDNLYMEIERLQNSLSEMIIAFEELIKTPESVEGTPEEEKIAIRYLNKLLDPYGLAITK